MQRDEKSNVWVFICLGAVLLVLYPLSLGPVAWLMTHGYISDQTIDLLERTVYLPLAWLIEYSEWVQSFFIWYYTLWGLSDLIP